jgi:hypothetical protein
VLTCIGWGRALLTFEAVNESYEQSRVVLPLETGEQPSLSSGLSDAPWLNRRRPWAPL